MRCVVCNFFLKSCTVDIIVRFTEVFQLFFAPLCLSFLRPHSSCVVHCVSRTLKSVVASKEKKNNFYSFNVRSQQNLFFQHNAFWTMVLKNVYFNIYLLHDLYIFVIYNWINFICCEIKSSVLVSLISMMHKKLDLNLIIV